MAKVKAFIPGEGYVTPGQALWAESCGVKVWWDVIAEIEEEENVASHV